MNPTTAATQNRELVFLRLEQYFPDFLRSLLPTSLWQAIPYGVLGAIAAVLTAAWVVRTIVRYTSADPSWRGRPGRIGQLLWGACVASWVLFGAWFLLVFFLNDTYPNASPSGSEMKAANRPENTALWVGFVGAVFALGVAYTVAMYVKDSRTVRWYWAAPLAALRVTVYAVLCVVFLLPAYQTYERTEKRSRVAVLLDVSPSITKKSDEIGGTPGKKLKSRLATVIDFLTDEKVAFLKTLLDSNPVVVYRFGTRLDEEPQLFTKDDAPWAASEWDAFANYDFKPFLLRRLSPEGAEAVRTSRPWGQTDPGTPEWAAGWLARPVDEVVPENMPEADKATLRENRDKLEKRVEVARTIALGTNVPDSLAAAVNREAGGMVQGIVVFSDGRSNLGSDSAYAELKLRARTANVPIFTVAVGEDRQTVDIVISDIQAPDNAPPDEPFKIVVEADAVNLANTETEVFLDLYGPNKDPKVDPADHPLPGKLTFLPGDPPHGQAEFVIDPAKLPDRLTEESEDAATKKRVLKKGPWAVRARIPKNKQEAFADQEHVRDRTGIQVIKKKLRVLLVASGPGREYQALKTMLVREVQESRAELCVLLQNAAGEAGLAVQGVDPERLLVRFPTKFDTTVKKDADPKERFYNLNEYDLIVMFDPDWSEVSQTQAEALQRWVQEQGGGLIYVADQVNTYQLARVEPNSRLSPVLDILPVVPDDIIAIRVKGTPRTARRLYLHPIEGSDLLKLEEGTNDPVAGWEKFFTDREKYAPSPDLKVELFPRRGFFSTYPLKPEIGVKAGSKVLADFADLDERGERVSRPWLVTNNPSAGWRSCFMGSGAVYRMFAYDPPAGKAYFERFWAKLTKYMAAKRNVKNARGRVLLSKEYTAGAPVRVQARILDPGSQKYPIGSIDPKFKIVRFSADGQQEKQLGPFPLVPKQGAGGFDGYYQGQVTPDPREMPPGDKRYRVVIDVPDSAGDTIEGEFMLRKSDPEMDNTRPDIDALRAMAGELDKDLRARIKKPETAERLARDLPREGGVPKLAFKLADKDLLALIPECMDHREVNDKNRGKAEDLWDQGFTLPESLTPEWLGKYPQQVSYVLLLLVGLLSVEWMTRKLLRLA
ncbi:MAG: hypothetical protein JWO38_6507 [Gemmataceae bacterium]|nr:hypothetical protein [Gemmataceae bacterium]